LQTFLTILVQNVTICARQFYRRLWIEGV